MDRSVSPTRAWSTRVLVLVASLAVVAQATIIVARAEGELAWLPLGALTAAMLGLLVGFERLTKHEPQPLLELLIVTISVGGLGMLFGGILDLALAPPPTAVPPEIAALPPCHRVLAIEAAGEPADAGGAGLGLGLLTWMNGLMIVSCVAGCALLCKSCHCTNRFSACGLHVVVSLGMIAGMFGGGWLLGLRFDGLFGAGAGDHLAMVAGMAGGVALSWPLARWVGGWGRA